MDTAGTFVATGRSGPAGVCVAAIVGQHTGPAPEVYGVVTVRVWRMMVP
ncbi:uncharacterized protein SOCE26_000770 [Sorangium cellulosum]|uniref:Uncharacterized protein n=1 Tax=Sorangium cellulosum TaxID=56 RepID=A0A2L0EHE0_SORCE|nr:uncharacterized protein SOCE26_000770 [Sorangium cellulosum]